MGGVSIWCHRSPFHCQVKMHLCRGRKTKPLNITTEMLSHEMYMYQLVCLYIMEGESE